MSAPGGALPDKSRGILSDLSNYFFNRPEIQTLVDFPTIRERVDYSKRILQRLAIDVDQYSVLNIHRIGIDAPVKYVFEEFFSEDMEARCWPDHFATQRRPREGVEEIQVVLCGVPVHDEPENTRRTLNSRRLHELVAICAVVGAPLGRGGISGKEHDRFTPPRLESHCRPGDIASVRHAAKVRALQPAWLNAQIVGASV